MSKFVNEKILTCVGKKCNIYLNTKGGNNIKKINSVQDWLPFDEVLDNRYNKIKKQLIETQKLVKTPIEYRHIRGHQKGDSPDAKWNGLADKLASII